MPHMALKARNADHRQHELRGSTKEHHATSAEASRRARDLTTAAITWRAGIEDTIAFWPEGYKIVWPSPKGNQRPGGLRLLNTATHRVPTEAARCIGPLS